MGTLLLLKVPAMTLPVEKTTAELSRQALMSLGEQGLVPWSLQLGTSAPSLDL